MELKNEIQALAARIGQPNVYAQIASLALDMAEQDVLQRLTTMMPGLQSVIVECESQYDDNGSTYPSVIGYRLDIVDQDQLELPNSDDEFLYDDKHMDWCLRMTKLLGMEITAEQFHEDIPEVVQESIGRLFGLLDDLPNFRGPVDGETLYTLKEQ